MRKLLTFVLAIALVFSFAMTTHAGFKDMWAQVYSWDGTLTADGRMELTKVTSGITYVVMMRNSIATPETLYYYQSDAMTSLANPVTGTNYTAAAVGHDMVRFRVDPAETNDTYVDLIVVDQAGGYTAFVEDFTEYKHSIIIDERPNVRHHGVAFILTTTSSTECDTGIDFDDVTIIDDMAIEVGTAFPTNTAIDVGILSTGTNGDADGFIDGEGMGTQGWNLLCEGGVDLTVPVFSSGGEMGCLLNEPKFGTFLGNFTVGSSDTEAGGVYQGVYLRRNLVIHGSWENSLSYKLPLIAANTGWGMIHFWFTRIR